METDINSVESALATKAGHPPAPEVAQAVASTEATPETAPEQAAPEQAAPPERAPIEPDDHVGVVLQHLPIDQNLKADLWDTATNAKNADELSSSLEKFAIPPHVAASLVVAKKLLDTERPAPSQADKIKAAAQAMSEIDPKTLDILETHPTVLKHLLSEPKS